MSLIADDAFSVNHRFSAAAEMRKMQTGREGDIPSKCSFTRNARGSHVVLRARRKVLGLGFPLLRCTHSSIAVSKIPKQGCI